MIVITWDIYINLSENLDSDGFYNGLYPVVCASE